MHIDLSPGPGGREVLRDRGAADAHPLREDILAQAILGLFVKLGGVAEIADILEGDGGGGHGRTVRARVAAERERDRGVQQEDGGEITGVPVLRVAIFHYVMDLNRELGIGLEPAFDLPAVEVLDREVAFVLEHKPGQFLRGVGDLVLRCVVGDVQVFDYLPFIHGDVLAVHGPLDLGIVPALRRILDEQAAANLRERIRHVRRDRDTALFLVHRQLGFLGVERAFAHPERENRHSERVEIGLGREFYEGAFGEGDRVSVDFRGGVDWGADLVGNAGAAQVQLVRDSEVAEDAVPVRRVADEDVRRLDVFVQHAGFVHLVQGYGSLQRDRKNRFRVPFQASGGGIAPGDIFHELIVVAVFDYIDRIAPAFQRFEALEDLLVRFISFVAELESIAAAAVRDHIKVSLRSAAQNLLDRVLLPADGDFVTWLARGFRRLALPS